MKIEFNKIHTVSNYISFIRLFLAIPIFYFVSNIDKINGARTYLISLYLFAYLTDILDGYFARKLNEISELGKIIDPFADKFLVIMIVIFYYNYDLIPQLYFWVIILRDLFIFTGGIFVSKKIGSVLPSNYLGKFTVLLIGIFLIIVTLGYKSSDLLYQIFYFITILLSILSVIVYAVRGYKEINKA
ncbi:MAG: CDP-alcohol phosphatidyltransferase family protein [Ignavibacteriae bacterium]|nr:CDP-alcohol phosphatidyltransferase family protein [Ignavibacteriota bacterium]